MPRRVPSGTRLAGHALERLLGDDPALGSSAIAGSCARSCRPDPCRERKRT